MKMKHTPGPWAIDDVAGEEILIETFPMQENRYICKVFKDRDDMANAKLIACAPDLLQELKNRHPFEICRIQECSACELIAKIEIS